MGKPVQVKLNDGTGYRGKLACLDGFMNITMEQTEEYVQGQLNAKYGDVFIRGNNGKFLYSTLHVLLLISLSTLLSALKKMNKLKSSLH